MGVVDRLEEGFWVVVDSGGCTCLHRTPLDQDDAATITIQPSLE